jgi:hypothetical protein
MAQRLLENLLVFIDDVVTEEFIWASLYLSKRSQEFNLKLYTTAHCWGLLIY